MAKEKEAQSININYNASKYPVLHKFLTSDAYVRLLMGPLGSGKSSACVMELLRRTIQQKPNADGIRKTRFALVRNTYPQLNDTVLKTVKDWIPITKTKGWETVYNDKYHTLTINIRLGDGTIVLSEWLFRALDRPDHVKNLLSMELTAAWINEAKEVPKAIFDNLLGRVGRYPPHNKPGEAPPTWFGIIMDTNPPDIDHWIYKLFEEDKPVNYEIFKQPSGLSEDAENIEHLPPHYYENLMAGKDEDWIRVYVKGQYGYVKEGKPVYPEFDEAKHLIPEYIPNPELPIILGFDFGLTPAVVFAQVLPNGRMIAFDEIYSENIGLRNFLVNQVKPHIEENYSDFELIITGDPAGKIRSQTDEKTAYDILREELRVLPKPAKTNSIEKRLDVVKKRLNIEVDGKPALLITENCRMLRKGFLGNYQLRRLKTSGEKYTDKPDKNEYSHIHDALQYVCLLSDWSFDVTGERKQKRERMKARTVYYVTYGATWMGG